jgi:hypothetical protein
VLPQGATRCPRCAASSTSGDRGIGTGLLCLTIWAAAGLVLARRRGPEGVVTVPP